MDELNLIAAEAKAIYQEIKDYIKEKHDVKVSSLYIAQVKQKYGIIERENYNTSKSENAKQLQCLPEKEKLIEEALRHFKMISQFAKQEITYYNHGDYFIPRVITKDQKEVHIGVWANRHRQYLKQFHRVRYYNLLTSEKLYVYLTDIEE